MFYEMAQLCAMFFCGSEITVGQETSKGVVKKYYFYKSLAKYLEQKYKCNNALCNIVRIEYMEHMPNPNEAEIRVAMSSSSKNSNIEAYCNYRKLKYGKVFEAIEDALELDDNYYNIVINIFIRNPMWMNAEKRGISNQFIYDNLYKYLKTQLNKRKNI